MVYMALHISPSGITCFPKVGTTFLTPSQYQKFHKMSTVNRQISTISELLTNLSIFESVKNIKFGHIANDRRRNAEDYIMF